MFVLSFNVAPYFQLKKISFFYLIVLKADKSNSFVVMNTTEYDKKNLSHLYDTITYTTITHNPTD